MGFVSLTLLLRQRPLTNTRRAAEPTKVGHNRAIPVRTAFLKVVVSLFVITACVPPEVPGPDWSEPTSPTPAPARTPSRLHVDGPDLRDEAGQLVKLRGVNVCALEFDLDGTNWNGAIPILSDSSRWNANVVRMPVNQEWFLTNDDYVTRVESRIDEAAVAGLYVVLDVQWETAERTDPYTDNILRAPTFGFGNTTEAFWHRASGRFSNRTNVLFDIINEPHDTPFEELHVLMQRMVERLARRVPDQLVVVGGPDWAHSVEPWRVRPLKGANVIYAAHQYLPYDAPEDFALNFENTAREFPVLISEFLAEDDAYFATVIERAEASGVDGWLPWAIGCGFNLDDDDRLAVQLRALNAR